jgi:hypothetical protein
MIGGGRRRIFEAIRFLQTPLSGSPLFPHSLLGESETKV